MKTSACVILYKEDRAPDDWRRFVALFCFIEFYTQFVWDGRYLWYLLTDPWYAKVWEQEYVLILIAAALGTLRAIVFWGFGRALWQDRRTVTRWLAAIIICSIAVGAMNSYQNNPYHDSSGTSYSSYWWGFEISSDTHPIILRTKSLLTDQIDHFPWLALLICALIFIWRKRDWRSVKRRPWVVLAAAWAFAMTAICILVGDATFWRALARVLRLRMGVGTYGSLSVLEVILPLLAGIWLLLTRKGAFLLPVLIAILTMSSIASFVYLFLPALVTADGSYRLILNSGMFDCLFVSWVASAGPWFVIAAYAWRQPMRMPADDGSPYPRRYCGHCHYNLHGIDSQSCPECGSALAE